MTEHLVIFQPSGTRGYIPDGTTLLEAAQQLGVGIEAICGGQGVCNKCRVAIQDGFFERFGIESRMAHLSPLTDAEEDMEVPPGMRLACMAQVHGPVVVVVPEDSRTNQQVVRKGAREFTLDLKPTVRNYYVELAPPTLDDPQADWERLCAALQQQYGLSGLHAAYPALRTLPDVLRAAGWTVTVSVWDGRDVIKVAPGLVEQVPGLAIDVGSTTLAAYLCDLRSGELLATDAIMNPQVAYGDDVMARLTYILNHDKGLDTLHAQLVAGLNDLIARVTRRAGLAPADVLETVVCGNTCMHHMLLHISPRHIGLTPFAPGLHHSVDIRAGELGLDTHPSGNVHVLPVIAGFLGADTVGCLVAEQLHRQDALTLLLDIGTNGEMVLGNAEKLVAASCATGPAFEGAQITFGMRAAEGAIERVTIDPVSLDVDYAVIGGGPPRGLCGSAIIDLGWELVKAGVASSTGRFNPALDSPRMRDTDTGREFVLVWASDTAFGRDITFSTHDMQALQLAKAAMYSAAAIMMHRLGVEDLERVVLAGAFGSYIDKTKAMAGGVIPDCDLDATYAVGNAAGDGARLCLLNAELRAEANRVAREIEVVELTLEPDFDRYFADAMSFPHAQDDFPHVQDLFDTARRARIMRTLRDIAPFDEWADEQIAQLAAGLREKRCRRRKPVFESDDQQVCVVVEGTVAVVDAAQHTQRTLAAGDWVAARDLPPDAQAIAQTRATHVLIGPDGGLLHGT